MSVVVETLSRSPYPGPRPFEPRDEPFFFGRDREKRELLSFLIAHRVVLLYSQSGAGNTSLLNAGLIPLLREESFEVLPVARVRGLVPEDIDLSTVANIYAFNTLIGWIEDRTKISALVSMALSSFLQERKPPLEEQGLPAPRVAIFDQFEELFTFYPERWMERSEFFRQLAQVLETDPLLRVLFIIREDYLANLEPYADLLPERLEARNRLERLRPEAACQAVEGPLLGTERSFAEGVALQLVNELLKIQVESATGELAEVPGEFVEPVQLQVVCQNLWSELPEDTTVVTADHLKVFGDVDAALQDFYEAAVARAVQEAGVTEAAMRAWVDANLITPAGTRGTVYQDTQSTGGLPNAAVDILEDQHLIRAEPRAGGRWYELTHDRFIKPIQRSNEAWYQDIRVIEAQEQIRREERERRERERARLRRLSRIVAGLALLLAAMAVLVAFFQQRSEAQRASQGWQVALATATEAQTQAEAQKGEAEAQKAEAEESKAVAEAQKTVAERATQLARSQALAESANSQLSVDPELSVILASEAGTVMRTPQAEAALRRALLQSRVRTAFRGHTGSLSSAAFSPDGKLIVTASADGTAWVWEAGTGQGLVMLQGHTDRVNSAAFSPDGASVVTASLDQTARLWEASSGKPLLELRGHSASVRDAVFSPDGRRIVTASADGTARVWDASTGQQVVVLRGHENSVNSAAFSPDGASVVTASSDQTARLWEASTGRSPVVLRGYSEALQSVAFSPDGKYVATASHDRTARVWDASTGEGLAELRGHTYVVASVAFSPNGKYVVTASHDNTARVWEVGSWRSLVELRGHTNAIVGVAFSPDSTRVATASWDGTARVWEWQASTEQSVAELQASDWGHVPSAAFSPDGKYVVTGSWDRTARIWETNSWQSVGNSLEHDGAVWSTAFSPDARLIVTGSQGGDSGVIRLWDVSRGVSVAVMNQVAIDVRAVSFSPDGKLVASTAGRAVRVWDASTWQPLGELQDHTGDVTSVAFSSDGKRLVTASRDWTARIWDMSTGRSVTQLLGHSDWVNSAAFSRDGSLVVTGSQDNTARVWDASTGQMVAELRGHFLFVNGAAFSPDGKFVVTASADQTARLWETATWRTLAVLQGHSGELYSAVFSPDSKLVVTASGDKTARIYACGVEVCGSLNEVLALARSRVTRSLTPEERKRYVEELPKP